jgi:uncharacterized membrane protein
LKLAARAEKDLGVRSLSRALARPSYTCNGIHKGGYMKKSLRLLVVLLSAFAILWPVLSYAGNVKSLNVRGKTIKNGDTADYVISILKKSDMVKQTVSKDPNNTNSLLIVKYYNVNGKGFIIHFARVEDPGPYKAVKIITE